ncbi:hypothetical protein PUN28_010047 [Cardiocondyla obscurior]
MNVQNKSMIYTINDVAPPSYAEVMERSRNNVEISTVDERCERCAHPSNYCQNNMSVYPQYEFEQQNQPTSIPYNTTTIITAHEQNQKCSGYLRIMWIISTVIFIVLCIFWLIYRFL